MLELRQITGDDCLKCNVLTTSEVEMYRRGKLVRKAQRMITLHRHALRAGFEFRPMSGYLFGGYYRNMQADLYMAIV